MTLTSNFGQSLSIFTYFNPKSNFSSPFPFQIFFSFFPNSIKYPLGFVFAASLFKIQEKYTCCFFMQISTECRPDVKSNWRLKNIYVVHLNEFRKCSFKCFFNVIALRWAYIFDNFFFQCSIILKFGISFKLSS